MRREVAGPEHTGDHALCVTVCNVEVYLLSDDLWAARREWRNNARELPGEPPDLDLSGL